MQNNEGTPFPPEGPETPTAPSVASTPMPAPPKAASNAAAKPKRCPECAGEVGPTTRGVMKIFCSKAHKAKYHARSKARGQALLPLLLAWRTGRGGTDIAKKAWAQVCTILDTFAAEDRKAGRPPVGEYVEKLLWMGTHGDRRRN